MGRRPSSKGARILRGEFCRCYFATHSTFVLACFFSFSLPSFPPIFNFSFPSLTSTVKAFLIARGVHTVHIAQHAVNIAPSLSISKLTPTKYDIEGTTEPIMPKTADAAKTVGMSRSVEPR